MLGDVLPAAFVACGMPDGARAMRLAVERLADRSVHLDEALLTLAPWLDSVAGQVQEVIRAEGFSAPGLGRQSLWSTLLAVREVFAQQPANALQHACDAARAAPSLRRVRFILEETGGPPAVEPTLLMMEAMEAGTEGAVGERRAQEEVIATLVRV